MLWDFSLGLCDWRRLPVRDMRDFDPREGVPGEMEFVEERLTTEHE